MNRLAVPFAQCLETGEFCYPTQVAKGLACNCICPVCESPVVAKQGDDKVWHFAHHTPTGSKSVNCGEGCVHLWVKHKLLQGKGASIYLPAVPLSVLKQSEFDHDWALEVSDWDAQAFFECVIDNARIEVKMNHSNRIADVILDVVYRQSRFPLIVEIFVSNKKGAEVISDFRKEDLACVEISIDKHFECDSDIPVGHLFKQCRWLTYHPLLGFYKTTTLFQNRGRVHEKRHLERQHKAEMEKARLPLEYLLAKQRLKKPDMKGKSFRWSEDRVRWERQLENTKPINKDNKITRIDFDVRMPETGIRVDYLFHLAVLKENKVIGKTQFIGLASPYATRSIIDALKAENLSIFKLCFDSCCRGQNYIDSYPSLPYTTAVGAMTIHASGSLWKCVYNRLYGEPISCKHPHDNDAHRVICQEGRWVYHCNCRCQYCISFDGKRATRFENAKKDCPKCGDLIKFEYQTCPICYEAGR